MIRSKLGWLVLGSALVLALGGSTAMVSGHGGDPTLVHSCVNKSSGEVKIVAASASCKANETALDWPRTSATPTPAQGGVLHARSNFSLAANATQFAMFVEEGTEAFVRVVLPRAGTFSNLFVHPTDAPASGALMTVVVRVNGVDTTLAVTHSSVDGTSATGNTIDTVTVNQGDFVALKFTESGGVIPAAVYRASFEFK
jgi:hypothetical protein